MARSKKSKSRSSATQVAPNFTVIALDESRGFRDSEAGRDLLKRSGGKIFSLSLYDSNRHLYIASLTPEYELITYEFVPAVYPSDEDEAERLNMDLIEVLQESEPVNYYNVSDIDRISSDYKNELGWNPDDQIPDDEDSYNEFLESNLEDVRGNDRTPKGVWMKSKKSNPKTKYSTPVEAELRIWLRDYPATVAAMSAAVDLSVANDGAKVYLHSDGYDRDWVAERMEEWADGRNGYTLDGYTLDGRLWTVRVM